MRKTRIDTQRLTRAFADAFGISLLIGLLTTMQNSGSARIEIPRCREPLFAPDRLSTLCGRNRSRSVADHIEHCSGLGEHRDPT